MVHVSRKQRTTEAQRSNRKEENSGKVEKDACQCTLGKRNSTQSTTTSYKKELVEFAKNNGVNLYEERDFVTPGWEGQPKGLLQVLRERGLIDISKLEQYTLDGKKDPITGVANLQSSYRHIMANCRDFREEETALEYLGTQLGVTVRLTPKFHAELAGEGIEYSWAHSKAFYRRLPLSEKRGRDSFKQLVRDSTCAEKVLTKTRIQKFAARARAYICTYHHLHQSMAKDGNQNLDWGLLYAEIERIMKLVKGHRCALDFDRGFVNSELKETTVKKRNEG